MRDNHEKTPEELIDDRRVAWSAPRSLYTQVVRPVSAEDVSGRLESPLGYMEDTVPLARYRPERLC